MTNDEKRRTGDARENDVAEYLSMHPETVRTMARSGGFPECVQDEWADVAYPDPVG
ncbi:hypothetical protein PUN71_022780 [Arthrobacter sp. NQ7]|uniref:helix-turn-helix domain-containing protein n=1 Tax=Arthrobacter sp. NQ7 TaxID=3032303 RepID=UPI001151D54D|nr:helix-turn-helix domain-containing protein [Arthrobacter sp. NQ7]MDJ0460039.1 hypothetical protein [Arthrobacter sp. NQ7]